MSDLGNTAGAELVARGERLAAALSRLADEVGRLRTEGAVRGEVLERVEAQTVLTNGRVSKLERWREQVRGGVIWAVAIFGALGWLAMFWFK